MQQPQKNRNTRNQLNDGEKALANPKMNNKPHARIKLMRRPKQSDIIPQTGDAIVTP